MTSHCAKFSEDAKNQTRAAHGGKYWAGQSMGSPLKTVKQHMEETPDHPLQLATPEAQDSN